MNTHEPSETEQSLIEHSPFSEIVDIQRFFPGGKRLENLDELLRVIVSAVPIVTLTGDEGSGKTMMCRMVEEKLSSNYVTVFFPQTVDSFEDVVRVVARRLEVEPSVAAGDIPVLLQTIVAILRERELRLLIIFDEAERIYLATLERVRKMLDQVNTSGPLLQIVLSGRSGLHNNFKNLALCTFLNVEERHFALEPLSREETFAYLNYAMQHEEQEDKQTKFSREAVEKIFLLSRGNFRLTNALAREALQALGPDTSFLVLLDNVQEIEGRNKPRRRLKVVTTKKARLNKPKLAWVGGVVCAAFVIFLLMRSGQKPDSTSVESSLETKNKIVISQPESLGGGSENSEQTPPAAEQIGKEPDKEKPSLPVETVQPVGPEKEIPAAPAPKEMVLPVAPKKEIQGTQVETAQSAAPEKEKPVALAVTEKTSKTESEKLAPSEKTTQPVAVEKEKAVVSTVNVQPIALKKEKPMAPVEVAQPTEPSKKEIAPDAVTPRPTEMELEKTVIPVVTIKAREIVKYRDTMVVNDETKPSPETIQRIKQEERKIAEIKLAKPVKIKSNSIKEETTQEKTLVAPVVQKVEEPKTVKIEPALVKEPTTAKKSVGADRQFSRRIAAGTPWLLGLKDDRYTVQLMVITDSDDEKKLKKLLDQESFKGQADKIYILRNESSPDVKYVFYGEYPTMTDARNARNTIPEFLRGNKPYAMSVKGAVRKVQQEE
ncbi:MAG: AAA family ATPase [Desulfoprunum sp.]|nr:AAA family ATPase [Desulfoprunum sp.]